MSFAECVQTIESRIKANSLLVSDATVMLLHLLRSRKQASPLIGASSTFYDQLEQALTKELLGYEPGQMDVTSNYRSCNIRTARLIDNVIVYIPNPVSTHKLYLMWGSQEVESLLAEVMDLKVFQSGDEKLIAREIEQLEAKNPMFHTETGFPDIWATFDGVELLRLYGQLKSALVRVCKQLLELERQAAFVIPPQVINVTQITF